MQDDRASRESSAMSSVYDELPTRAKGGEKGKKATTSKTSGAKRGANDDVSKHIPP